MVVRRERVVSGTPDDVWRVVSDPARLPAWWPGVSRVEEASREAWTTVLVSPMGKSVRADYSLVEAREPERLQWKQEVEESPFERILAEYLTEIGLEPDDGSTRVRMVARMKLRGFARFGSFQLRRAAAKQLSSALDGIEAAVGEG